MPARAIDPGARTRLHRHRARWHPGQAYLTSAASCDARRPRYGLLRSRPGTSTPSGDDGRGTKSGSPPAGRLALKPKRHQSQYVQPNPAPLPGMHPRNVLTDRAPCRRLPRPLRQVVTGGQRERRTPCLRKRTSPRSAGPEQSTSYSTASSASLRARTGRPVRGQPPHDARGDAGASGAGRDRDPSWRRGLPKRTRCQLAAVAPECLPRPVRDLLGRSALAGTAADRRRADRPPGDGGRFRGA